MGGRLNELNYEAAEPQRMTVLSGFMVTGNYQTNLTCVEHWLPLFAVAPFAAGVAASGSSTSSVALGFPRIFPSETPHVLI